MTLFQLPKVRTMKSLPCAFATYLALAISASPAMATELSATSLEGTWMFTHIMMDGERDMKVNRKTQFLADRSLVHCDAAGNEKARGTYEVTGDTIVYTDDKGKQNRKVLAFDGNSLHVDHRGAEMFFERP
jgi:hypothetical protein